MKNYIIYLGILLIVSSKTESFPISASYYDTFRHEDHNSRSTNEYNRDVKSLEGTTNSEDLSSSSLPLTETLFSSSESSVSTVTTIGSISNVVSASKSKPKKSSKQGVQELDGFEDAILAALELSNTTPLSSTKKYKIKSKSTTVAPSINSLDAAPDQTVAVTLPPNYVVIDADAIANGKLSYEQIQALIQMQEQLAAVMPVETTTRESAPGEYIANIFGSLASANLLGIADNTFKLLGTSHVQNFFVGLADQVSCQLSNSCKSKTSKKDSETKIVKEYDVNNVKKYEEINDN